MRRLFLAMLSVVLGTLGLSEAVRADEPNGQSVTPAFHRDKVVVPPPICGPGMPHPGFGPGPGTKPPACYCLNPHWWGCGSDRYNPGCDNLKDECRFLFGSCREFYGQPCLKQWHPLIESHHGAHP